MHSSLYFLRPFTSSVYGGSQLLRGGGGGVIFGGAVPEGVPVEVGR